MEYRNETENEIKLTYDMDCIKNFFNLPQNSKMMVNQFDSMIFYVATGMKCSDEDIFFETHLGLYDHISSWIKLSCVQLVLQQLEPTSKLVENFNISEADRQECKEILLADTFEKAQQEFESKLGPLNAYTCGAISENGGNDFLTFLAKSALIKIGNITEELKKSEKEKLKEYLKDVSIKAVNCVVKRFEDDPQGRFIIFEVTF